jgi:lipid A 3-O-deacylase
MFRKIGLFGVVFLSFMLGMSQEIFSQGPEQSPVLSGEVETELEYLEPIDKDRQIRTISFNILVPSHKKWKSFVFYKGLTITRSWGDVDRWGLIDPDSSAFGIGPFYLARKQWWQWQNWQLITDFSGGFILYSDNFPAGGTTYNFMWRLGPRLTYKTGNKTSWNFGYTLMHVSNGKMEFRDPSPNPGYNAGGFTISMNHPLIFFSSCGILSVRK